MGDTTNNGTSRTTADGPDRRDDTDSRAAMARALARGGMEGVNVISWETASEITPRRREILRTVQTEAVESVSDLARTLDRDKSQVSRDLSTLAELGVVSFETEGKRKRPVPAQETLVVEPLV